MLWSPCWVTSIPVSVNALAFLDPNANLASNLCKTCWNFALPPPMPSSTWTPRMPTMAPWAGVWRFGAGSSPDGMTESSQRTNTQGSNGQASIPNRVNSWTSAQYQRYGASIKP